MAKKDKNLPAIHREGGFFETFGQLQEQIRQRAHEIFRHRDEREGDELSDWLAAESEVLTSIALDFQEEDDKYVLSGEVPGFAPEEVDIYIDGAMLTVGGTHTEEKKSKKGKEVQSSEVHFFRQMTLPADADAANMDASVADGILEVVLPKRPLTP